MAQEAENIKVMFIGDERVAVTLYNSPMPNAFQEVPNTITSIVEFVRKKIKDNAAGLSSSYNEDHVITESVIVSQSTQYQVNNILDKITEMNAVSFMISDNSSLQLIVRLLSADPSLKHKPLIFVYQGEADIAAFAQKVGLRKWVIIQGTPKTVAQEFRKKLCGLMGIPLPQTVTPVAEKTAEEIKAEKIRAAVAAKRAAQGLPVSRQPHSSSAFVQSGPVEQESVPRSTILPGNFEYSIDDASTPLISQFFQYTYAPALKHSRQLRATEINESLAPDDNGKYEPKQLMMLFAHYMSIRHVNSTLSRQLENELARPLEFEIPNVGRATIRGKKHDQIANALREKLEEKFGSLKKIDLLIQILDCVDDLETGFFSYKSETGKAQIAGTMELANRVYEHLAMKNFFTDAEVSDLIRGLTLPSDAIKIMRNAIPDPSINPLM